MIKGPALGATIVAIVTPLLKWTNHVYNGEKMPRGNYFSVAGAYGFLSSPLNQLRFRKQCGLTTTKVNKSYFQHAQDIFNQDLNASATKRVGFFFKAAVPRAITTTIAAGLMVKGTEVYEVAVNSCKR